MSGVSVERLSNLKEQTSKELRFLAVVVSALELITESGLQNFSISTLARKSKISRPWIYQYIGRTKSEVINVTIHHWGQYFSQTGTYAQPSNLEELKQRIEQGNEFVFKTAIDFPVVIRAYFKFKG